MTRGVRVEHRQCLIAGCGRPFYGHGWCQMHWQRWRNTGRTDPVTPEDRFWPKVNFLGQPAVAWDGVPLPGVCWNWLGGTGRIGHGRFRFNGRTNYAYRFSYEQIVGPIPDGYEVDHLCRNPRCVNPQHLEAVTQDENLRRAAVARQAQKESAA